MTIATPDFPTITIRRATPRDADALARLRWEFRAGIGEPDEAEDVFVARCARWMRARLGYETWRAWVAETDGGIVGTAWLQLVEKMPNPVVEAEVYGYVTNVFLREEMRGRGAGSQLMAAVLDECAVAGVEAAFLWPTERSRALHRRHGFDGDGPMMVRKWEAASS
ncbi:MAG TPA: GNAT family N-acetyltransferase [Longimicrobium sp.]|nr:GNAT family N-acetyltransferase [Longimicrobium sp.]